jgi:hypothetical protein
MGVSAMEVFFDFATAAAVLEEGQTVCGTYKPDGTPAYFVMPVGVDEHTMRVSAFEVRNGRPMTSYETALLDVVLDRAAE